MPTAHPLVDGGNDAANSGTGTLPGMRDCQIEAITGLEKSFAENRPRALIHMATGAGKTFTACAFTYRLIKHAGARHILFLVDRANLGEQARDGSGTRERRRPPRRRRARRANACARQFHRFRTPDTGRLFTVPRSRQRPTTIRRRRTRNVGAADTLYNVQHLTSPHLDDVCRVTICTIQRLYSILRGEELAEGADDLSGAELAAALGSTRTRDVAYNPAVPIEKFDFIVTDECHRSIYNLWRQVLEYFDAFLLGLTATPAPQTIAYFHQNGVAGSAAWMRSRPPNRRLSRRASAGRARQYNHERAVADGVNVGYDVCRIKTRVTEQGGKVVPSGEAATRQDAANRQAGPKGFLIDHRSKASRAARSAVLADDLDYTPADLDRSVVVPDQIRTVLRTYRDAVSTVPRPLRPTTIRRRRTRSVGAADTLFPGRTLVPKTLIFAKDDSHAEDIVHLCREVFGKGNDFAKKITYMTYNPDTKRYEKSETLIQEFRTSPQLRIAVTVDMIATGTDIKPLECLLFLRDTRSRTYFEQMKGRGTRVLTPTDLQAVSGEDARTKTHFVIVDGVGVCESDKTDSRPLERQRTVAFDKLLLGVALGKRDEDTLTTLAGRLARLKREINHKDTKTLRDLTGGKSLGDLARDLLNACDSDFIATAVQKSKFGELLPEGVLPEPTPSELSVLRASVVQNACAPFDASALRDALVKAKQEAEQTIDVTTEDVVLSSGFDAAKAKAASLTQAFRDYLAQRQTEIDALQILYSRPFNQRLTEPMLKELEKKLRDNHAAWTEDRLWDAFAVTAPDKVEGRSQAGRFADLVSLVRFALEKQPVLEPFADSVAERFDSWIERKAKGGASFTADQRAWLELMRDQIATTCSIEPDDLDYAPFSQRGGLGRAHQLFGDGLNRILDELNVALVA